MVKGSLYVNMNQVNQNEYLYGTLLSENIIGVIHDHYVTFHLNMDIDGPSNNSFVKVNLQKEMTSPGESPRRSYLKAIRNVAKTEKDAQIKLKLYDPSEFHVINSNKKSKLGTLLVTKLFLVGLLLVYLTMMILLRRELLLQITKFGSHLIMSLSNGLLACLFIKVKVMILLLFGLTGNFFCFDLFDWFWLDTNFLKVKKTFESYRLKLKIECIKILVVLNMTCGELKSKSCQKKKKLKRKIRKKNWNGKSNLMHF